MQITLGHDDVQEALSQYVTNQGINTEGKEITFNFIAGRRGNGLKVEVNISSPSVKSLEGDSNTSTTVPQKEVVEAEPEVTKVTEEPASLFATA